MLRAGFFVSVSNEEVLRIRPFKNTENFSVTLLRKRLFAVTLATAFLFLLIFARFFQVQIVQGEKLRYRALDQWTRELPVVASRGRILDANGVVLADNAPSWSVFVRPNAVRDKNETAAALAEIFQLDAAALARRLKEARVSEITLVRRAPKDRIDRLERCELAGVYFARDNTRVYPYGSSLSRVLGFTSVDNAGLTGLEKYYDGYLAGKKGEIAFETDLVGAEIGGKAYYLPAVDGTDLVLTVDHAVQSVCESVMEKLYEEHRPVTAQAIVLDPNTFEVLAMAEAPSYDLNDVPRDDPEKLNALSRNNLLSDIYEPGSTFKIVTAAANIEEYFQGNTSAFSLSYRFNSSRTRTVEGTTVKCWSNHANGKHSNQTLAEALCNSCNPCFTDIALALGKKTFYEYLEKFGFGRRTGIDFSGEASGMLRTESAVRACDLARIGFGQTVAVTALQLACAGASAVNGGYYYKPRLVKELRSESGIVEKTKSELVSRPIGEKASRTLSALLEGVVENGSGNKAFIEGYRVGGKTGTAQKFKNGAIAQGKYVSSFLGFFPSDAPRYLALVIVDEPQGAYYGSVVAAPAAREIFQGIIDAKGIRPFK